MASCRTTATFSAQRSVGDDGGLCQQLLFFAAFVLFLLSLFPSLTQRFTLSFSHFDGTITITGTHMQTGEEVGIKLVRKREKKERKGRRRPIERENEKKLDIALP